ncbi:CPBP family intramembrane metalloprotease [Leptospira selangorensis]|uniref:CPBP family intramembrane metalloprotease n=1 Tax=Leptospira selangorensis TaxID=2484982 RepID=A0A5F2BY37_9LEPT|nr:type II CAAX endopeptidase family protein [Leptospira selangorensis]TGM16344.1 CPBP family intramembrane metalloprotease [Leptospira selangorensis]TGM17705.1 CPBP family intramembrane metalloprotease [Leptospira selangorensis]
MNFSGTGRIDLPEYKAGGRERFFIFLSITTFSIAVFEEVRALYLVPVPLLLFLLIGFQFKWKSLFYLNIPLFVLTFINIFPYGKNLWPGTLVFALIFYFFTFSKIRNAGLLRWLARGEVSKQVLGLSALFVLSASVALFLWFYLLDPDISDIKENFPKGDIPLLIAAGVGFAIINAVAEEFLFRGILFEALLTAGCSLFWALVFQALSFGILHLHGFPRGWVGVGLAGIYGLMTGLIRILSKGIYYPILVHIFADITIAGIVLFFAK